MYLIPKCLDFCHCMKYTRTRVPSDPFFPYKNRIVVSVVKQENMGQGKPVIWHILQRVIKDLRHTSLHVLLNCRNMVTCS